MGSSMRETQYFRTANAAYKNIVEDKMEIHEAWHAAAIDHITSEESRKKSCPKNTFIVPNS